MTVSAPRGSWGSRLGFILAAAGSAVGLGNIWKFPYIAGQNGGGAFVLVYLVCILVMGLPIMMAELMLGRATRRNAVGAFLCLERRRTPWVAAGWLGVGASFIILSYYAVVAGWTLDYVVASVMGSFTEKAPGEIEAHFGKLIASGSRQILWQLLFLGLTLGIVLGGVRKGIERWSKILMPVLFILLLILVGNGLLSDGAGEGLHFLFRPDFHRLTASAVLEAMGHAFFTLSLGMAIMITYGSYLSGRENLLSTSVRIIGLDTLIALMAGIAIFSVVFSVGMAPAAGPGLVFKTIPVAFSQLPGGYFLCVIFFALIAFAALTSAVSLLEAQVAYFIDERHWSRSKSTLALGGLLFLAGIPSALSFNLLADWHLLGDRSFFDSVDLIASNYLLPLCGLAVAVYVGWFWRAEEKRKAFGDGGAPWIYFLWNLLIRYVAPLAVGAVLWFKMQETGLLTYLSHLFSGGVGG